MTPKQLIALLNLTHRMKPAAIERAKIAAGVEPGRRLAHLDGGSAGQLIRILRGDR